MLKNVPIKKEELVEVGFKDGNDNPEICNEAGLIEKNFIIM
jgi:hypothetical protein